MKKMMVVVMIILLFGCVHSGIKADDTKKNIDNLTKFSRDIGLSIQGYDLECINRIEAMEKCGDISHAKARYMIHKECKKPEVPKGSYLPCEGGIEIARAETSGMSVFPYVCTYKCPDGKIYQKECF